VGELGGGLEGLGPGEAAGVDEVLLDGERWAWVGRIVLVSS
jgi:hypothetical protein